MGAQFLGVAFPIRATRFKSYPRLSEETTAFSADLVDANGAPVGSIENDGKGGGPLVRFVSPDARLAIEAWILTTPAAKAHVAEGGSEFLAAEFAWNAIVGEAEDEPLRTAYARKAQELPLPSVGTEVAIDAKGTTAKIVGWSARSKDRPIVLRNETHEIRTNVATLIRLLAKA